MLGDTSAQPVTAPIRGTGCETTVADPKQAGGLRQPAPGRRPAQGLRRRHRPVQGRRSRRASSTTSAPRRPATASTDLVTARCAGEAQRRADLLNDMTDQAVELRGPRRPPRWSALTYPRVDDQRHPTTGRAGPLEGPATALVGGRLNDAVWPDRAAAAPRPARAPTTPRDQAARSRQVAANAGHLEASMIRARPTTRPPRLSSRGDLVITEAQAAPRAEVPGHRVLRQRPDG